MMFKTVTPARAPEKLKNGKCMYINFEIGSFKAMARNITKRVPKKETALLITPFLKPITAPKINKIMVMLSIIVIILLLPFYIKYIIFFLILKVVFQY